VSSKKASPVEHLSSDRRACNERKKKHTIKVVSNRVSKVVLKFLHPLKSRKLVKKKMLSSSLNLQDAGNKGIFGFR